MGATNTTANYSLSQFVSTDKPAWLQDYNGDMLKIDTGINAAKIAADSAALDAGAAQSDATAANTAINNTITPAITALQTTVGNQGGAINTINSLIGNGTPTTTDQTIIGAINEINGKIDHVVSSIIADGVKTIGTIFNELYASVATLSNFEKSNLKLIEITSTSTNIKHVSVITSTELRFFAVSNAAKQIASVKANGSTFEMIANDGTTTDYTSSVATNGTEYYLIY